MKAKMSSLFKELPETLREIEISGIQLDSRKVQPGDLFVALKGAQVDGAKFIASAFTSGAAVVISDSEAALEHEASQPIWYFKNLKTELPVAVSQFYGNPSKKLNLVGVTGTNGKTSVAYFVAQISKLLGQNSAFIGTTGQGMLDDLTETINTTPDVITLNQELQSFVNQGADICAMEVSSHGLDQGRVAGLEFDVAIFTNLTRDHLDYHGTMSAYGDAKAKLFDIGSLKKKLVCIDDDFGQELAERLKDDTALATLSCTGLVADIQVSSIQYLNHGVEFVYQSSITGQVKIFAKLLGGFNVTNLSLAISALVSLGYSIEQICAVLSDLTPVAGRMQAFSVAGKPTVVVDYAHTPDALEKAIRACRRHTQNELWVVFGCGGDRDKGKRPEMARVAEKFGDKVLVTDDNPRTESSEEIFKDIFKGFSSELRVESEHDRTKAIHKVFQMANAEDLILVAGKGHEDYQVIGTEKVHLSDIETVRSLMQGGENDSPS